MSKIDAGLVSSFFKSLRNLEPINTQSKRGSRQKSEFIYMFRAFGCRQMLLDEYSWIHITTIFPHLISEFFNKMFQCMNHPSPKVNTSIVFDLLEVFLRRDPEQTMLNIIQFNLPFILLWNIDRQNVRDFLLKLLNTPLNYFKLGHSTLQKLSKYLKLTDFFLDYLNIMVDKSYKMDPQKVSVAYKPQQLHKVYEHNNKLIAQITTKSLKARKISTVCAITLKKTKDTQLDPFALAEERHEARGDIDGIIEFTKTTEALSPLRRSMLYNSDFDCDDSPTNSPLLQKSNSDQPNSGKTRPSKMYPSLMESMRKEEENKAKEKASLNSHYKDKRYGGRSKPLKNVNNTNVSRPSSRDEKHDPRPNSRQSNTSIANDVSQLIPLHVNRDNSSEKSLKKVDSFNHFGKKKHKVEPIIPFTGENMLKMLHPSVNQDVYLSHFQGVNAPLTQAVINVSALPSRALNKSGSSPQLTQLRRSIQEKGELLVVPQEKLFSPRTVKNNESLSLPLANGLLDIVQLYFDRCQQTKLMMAAGIESTMHLKLVQCIKGGQETEFFRLLLKVDFCTIIG